MGWRTYLEFALAALLFTLLAVVILTVYANYGIGWDFMAHYLGAKSILNPSFPGALSSIIAQTKLGYGASIISKSLYFEIYRAPLSTAVLAFLIIAFNTYSISAYLVLMVIMLFAATIYASRNLGINLMLLSSLVVLPYIVIFPFMGNSEELLSLSLVIATLALEAKGKWQSGAALALACMAKYTALIFLPLLLLTGSRKRILYAYAAFALVTAHGFS